MRKVAFLIAVVPTLVAQSSTSPCDLNGDGVVSVADVQIAVNEVLGLSACTMNLDGTGTCDVADVQRIITAALGGSCVSLQIHNLKYETEASLKVNNGAWIPINSSSVTLLGQADTFGGIGGGFSTLSMTMNLPPGSITAGNNTVTFQFNGTNGITSAFRVLNINVLDANSNQLIPQSSFSWDDPTKWQPPLNDAANIQAGQTLWQTASLTTPGMVSIQATCGMCHAQDGRDLKYFNYSNASIQARAVFHGLTAQQGNQIASYIRSLNTPAPASARPWNPPYQPGPGLDSQPVSDWAAGAGLSAVLAHDSDMLAYIMPNGSTANWSQNAYLNPRETPISFPLPDWNSWLPIIHPVDAWGSSFTSSQLNQLYLSLRQQLQPNNATVYGNVAGPNGPWQYWLDYRQTFMTPLTPSSSDPAWANETFVHKVYSINLWSVVKNWELNQEFGVEGFNQLIFGPQAPSRGWMTNMLFRAGPGITGIPRPSPGIGNGSVIAHIYDSVSWYELELVLNSGLGGTIDWPYFLGYPTNDLTWDAPDGRPRVGTAGLLTLWTVSALQQDNQNDAAIPKQYVEFPSQVSWPSEISSTQKLQILNGYVSNWIAYYGPMSLSQFQALPMWQNGNATFTTDPHTNQFGTDLIYTLPQLKFAGVNPALLSQIATWAATIGRRTTGGTI